MSKDKNRETLELSEEVLRNFELSELPTHNIVLKCLRLARIINDIDAVDWLKQEANGFEEDQEGYLTSAAWKATERSGRRYYIDDPKSKASKPQKVARAFTDTIAVMESKINAANARMAVAYDRDISISCHSTYSPSIPPGNSVERNRIAEIIEENTEKVEKVKSRLYQYVLSVNYELKFGDIAEDIFTRKRINVDKTLKDICPDAIQKFVSIYENLKSDNKEDWANAVHTCRRIIKEVADVLYPPSNDPVELPGGRTVKVGKEQYINRLVQYIGSKSTSENYLSIVGSHLKFIGERLDGVHEAANKGTHAEVTLEEAERYIIYTYLVVGDILSL